MALLLSGLDDIVADDEDIARFLTQSSHFRGGKLRPAALLPSPADRETSVSRHGPEPAERLQEIGQAAAGASAADRARAMVRVALDGEA